MPDYDRSFFLSTLELTFDCRFPMNAEETMPTLGDVHDYIVSTLGFGTGGSVGMHVFHTIRRALVEGAGLRRSDVKIDANLDELMPRQIRRSMWNEFLKRLPWDTSHLYLRFPARIARPLLMVAVCALVALWVVGGILAWLHVFSLLHMAAVVVALSATVYFLATETHNPLAVEIPEVFSTPRKITRYLVKRNYGKIAKQSHMWNETEVWAMIEEIAKDTRGSSQSPYHRSTLIADL